MPTNYPAYYEARVKGTLHGSETINVWHFGGANNPANNDALVLALTELANAIIQCVIDFWIPATTQDWTLEGVDVKRLWPTPSDPIEIAAPAATVGQRQAVNASFETIVLRLRSGVGGKRNRGRKFMPPPGDADITNSVMNSDPVNDFMSQFILCMKNKFVGAGRSEEFALVVLSPTTLREQPNNYQASTVDVLHMIIEQRLTHLHSRKLGVGG